MNRELERPSANERRRAFCLERIDTPQPRLERINTISALLRLPAKRY